jgi:hypothetical protein
MAVHRSPARRRWLVLFAGAAALSATPFTAVASGRARVDVWKSPTCGCCSDWVAHMRDAGFELHVHDTGNVAARSRLGMPARFGSCHTATVAGYVLEGHVPASDVRRLLRERPDALGLAVPGMPVGSPGMDGPEYGGRRDPYDTVLVARDGSPRVFVPHR